jgi:hypothetical protein
MSNLNELSLRFRNSLIRALDPLSCKYLIFFLLHAIGMFECLPFWLQKTETLQLPTSQSKGSILSSIIDKVTPCSDLIVLVKYC